MNLRTITCWVLYNPKRKIILNGFRSATDMKRHYADGWPKGYVVVKMKGNYVAKSRRVPQNGASE